MRNKIIAGIIVAGFSFGLATGSVQADSHGGNNDNPPAHASDNRAVKGVAEDTNAPALGEIKYLFNKAGYHFWFTPSANIGLYEAGDSYHNVYKYQVDDPTNWCGPVNIPDRAPYNAGGTAGHSAYYKIWNVTDEVFVCGSD